MFTGFKDREGRGIYAGEKVRYYTSNMMMPIEQSGFEVLEAKIPHNEVKGLYRGDELVKEFSHDDEFRYIVDGSKNL